VFTDSAIKTGPFSFEQCPLGEYVFATDWRGRTNRFHRIIFKSPLNIIKEFEKDKVPQWIKDIVILGQATQVKNFVPMLESIVEEDYKGKPFTRTLWIVGSQGASITDPTLKSFAETLKTKGQSPEMPMFKSGYHEFPVSIGTWENLGSDAYGVGPGIKAIKEIKRLQDMEKAVRLASHKDVDPPTAAPAYMRGTLNTHPGGENWVRTHQDRITSIYDRGFNYDGISKVIERVEMGIKLKFYNDVFLTTARDPNATPMKAAEVHVKDGERMLRLGAAIEKMIPEYFYPQIERSFNIALRKGYLPPMPQEYEDLVMEVDGGYDIKFISPLAQAQKLIGVKAVQDFMITVGQASTVHPKALYKLDIFKALDEIADSGGTPPNIVVPTEEAEAAFNRDMQAKQQMQQKQEQMAEAQVGSQVSLQGAQEQKARAEGGQALTESILARNEFGLV